MQQLVRGIEPQQLRERAALREHLAEELLPVCNRFLTTYSLSDRAGIFSADLDRQGALLQILIRPDGQAPRSV